MSETLMALMKKSGGSDLEYIDEDIAFEFPEINQTKYFYVYSNQGKAPKSVFAEVIGAETTNGCFWDVDEPLLCAVWRTTNHSSYTGYLQGVGNTINGLTVNEIGADYIKFAFKNASGYSGTSVHVKISFE